MLTHGRNAPILPDDVLCRRWGRELYPTILVLRPPSTFEMTLTNPFVGTVTVALLERGSVSEQSIAGRAMAKDASSDTLRL